VQNHSREGSTFLSLGWRFKFSPHARPGRPLWTTTCLKQFARGGLSLST